MNQVYLLKLTSFFAVIGVLATLLIATPYTSAEVKGSASFLIASETHTVDSVFPVTIYEDSGNVEVNVMAVDLQYDPTKLELIKVEQAPSGLMSASGPPEIKAGSVIISRMTGTSGGVKGRVLFAVAQFRALTSGGTTSLTVGPQSQIYSMQNAENIWDGKSDGATITLTQATIHSATKGQPTQSQRSGSSQSRPIGTSSPTQISTTTSSDPVNTGPVTVSVIGSSSSRDPVPAAAIGAAVGIVIAITTGAVISRRKYIKRDAHETQHKKRVKHV